MATTSTTSDAAERSGSGRGISPPVGAGDALAGGARRLSPDPPDVRGREIFRQVCEHLDRKHGAARRPSPRERAHKARQATAYVCYLLANDHWLRRPTLAEASEALGIPERTLKNRRALAAEALAAGQWEF